MVSAPESDLDGKTPDELVKMNSSFREIRYVDADTIIDLAKREMNEDSIEYKNISEAVDDVMHLFELTGRITPELREEVMKSVL